MSRFFGAEDAATLARIQVLAMLVTYVALGGFHLRISAEHDWLAIIVASNKAGLLAIQTGLFLIIPLLVYQHFGDQTLSIVVVILWSVGILLQVILSYALIAGGRNLSVAVLRAVNAAIFLSVIPIWSSRAINFSDGVLAVSIAVVCTNLFAFLTLLRLPNESRQGCFYMPQRLSSYDIKYAAKNFLFLTTNNLNASLIFLIPGLMGSSQTLVLIFFATRVLAAIIQGIGNPMSQWFVGRLGAKLEDEYRLASIKLPSCLSSR